jgi:hypothetical protein
LLALGQPTLTQGEHYAEDLALSRLLERLIRGLLLRPLLL